ncbi:hypothetical protein [Belliella aquatica]|uniref:Leucine-binding protein domain-containing protein n=1 Tax=Belliella aquatica TaxID=1323734 RepID=A0ABQ1MY61_9BACT|nr:hypothetical protein [Belliella aquatica]MCH7407454.1 hypothetical protein [Belliella aquatica]GGC49333.1 hypothetical protein GCM10010993_29760 [Belliella aquatica]
MKNLGILLPKSNTHPEIGYDFFFGLKAFFAQQPQFDISFSTSNIGFGIDEDLLFSEAERMLLEKNVDALVVFAEHPKVDKIFPLGAQFQRPILVVNLGAKYPVNWKSPDYVMFITMGEMLSAKLAAKDAVSDFEITKGVNATNFYDGGYGIGDGFYLGQDEANGQIVYNFFSKHLVEEYDGKTLLTYLESNKEPMLIFSIFTGKILPLFLKDIEASQTKSILVCSSAMINEIIASDYHIESKLPKIFAYSSIDPNWKTDGFQPINDFFRNEAKRKVSSMSYLGWDAGKVLTQFFIDTSTDWKNIVSLLETSPLKGCRGELIFHAQTGHFIGEQYRIRIYNQEFEVVKIEVNEVEKEWERFIKSRSEPPQVGWLNTYLCS